MSLTFLRFLVGGGVGVGVGVGAVVVSGVSEGGVSEAVASLFKCSMTILRFAINAKELGQTSMHIA